MEQISRPTWMDDELVKDIPQRKLDFAAELFQNGREKNQKEMMAFIMPMMKRAKAENLTFSQNELNACIQAIKKHSTQEELSKIDKLMTQKGVPTPGKQ